MRTICPLTSDWMVSLRGGLARCLSRDLSVGLFLGLLGASSLQGAVAESILIELRPRVELKGRKVTLGDIALIQAPEEVSMRRLESLPLGRVPRWGDTARLSRQTLQRWIHYRARGLASRITWSGSETSLISSAGESLSGETIASAALKALRNRHSGVSYRSVIRLAEEPASVTIPAGPLELKIRESKQEEVALDSLPSRRQIVVVEVWVDGRFVLLIPVECSVALFAPAYVAARDLFPGEILDSGSLQVSEVEWTGRTSTPLAVVRTPPALESSGTQSKGHQGVEAAAGAPYPFGMRLRRTIKAGEPLILSQVEPAPLVHRGQFATLRAVEGTIEVESKVEVLQDGSLGQTVRVKLPRAGSSIPARVSSKGIVEVLP